MAETYDTVTSEVHHFSKEESLDPSRGGKEKFGHNEVSKLHQMAETSRGCRHVSREATTPQDDEEEEEEEFECLLGANGQVVLWSSRRETVLSRFDFVYPPYMVVDKIPILSPVIDSDGDLQVTRKKDLDKKEGVVLIEHQSATTLDLVGEQVWRGALFMADFILNNPDIFRDAHILEVASGVGLTSIVAAMLAKQVIISDIDRGDILELIDRNIKRNTDLLKASVEVKEIDFFNHATIDEIMDVKKSVSILLAADVVYHDQLTDAFFRTILRLMSDPPNKSLYVALEKRFVFTQEDMDTVAPCYEHFLQGLEWLASQNLSQIDWTMEQLSTDFEQYFTYERTRHLVLWKIQATLK
ncbi:methyltransferase-like protein 22 isoform X2 [Procambarus clarkii]|uniref:methyltransferase-like protein 22 isoform X2 n=1 Tax=Procambarus clarkii TaxID=6728 RepID=UPI001E674EFB|nr:methyltransferase-like protein 22 isoform X2 [Procambarus clarkii]